MKETKFRAFVEGKMYQVMGFLWNEDGTMHRILLFDKKYDAILVIKPERATTMQYIGLNDCTGKEIFKGDIVEYSDPIFGEKGRGFVDWYIDRWVLRGKGFEGDRIGVFKNKNVTGNIHENPELLGE